MWKDADKPDQSQTLLIDIPNVQASDLTDNVRVSAKLLIGRNSNVIYADIKHIQELADTKFR